MLWSLFQSPTLNKSSPNKSLCPARDQLKLTRSKEVVAPPPPWGADHRYALDFIEVELLGEGGFGKVYKVYNKIDGRLYAVKKIFLKSQEICQPVLQEIRILSRLDHLHVIRYYSTWMDVHPQGLSVYIQMELCQMNLAQYLETRNYQGTFDRLQAWKLLGEILQGVSYIHQCQIIHRDLNPHNIFLTQDHRVKIGDFGLSALQKSSKDTINTTSDGHALYTAPEIIRRRECSLASDIYSLGLIIVELMMTFGSGMERYLTLTQIKDGEWHKWNSEEEYKKIIPAMMASKPDHRPDIEDLVAWYDYVGKFIKDEQEES
jgi:serine/threonine protein kinase